MPTKEPRIDRLMHEAMMLPESGKHDPPRKVFLDKSMPGQWYANIWHEKGYTVWYMPGDSPEHALSELIRALKERRERVVETS